MRYSFPRSTFAIGIIAFAAAFIIGLSVVVQLHKACFSAAEFHSFEAVVGEVEPQLQPIWNGEQLKVECANSKSSGKSTDILFMLTNESSEVIFFLNRLGTIPVALEAPSSTGEVLAGRLSRSALNPAETGLLQVTVPSARVAPSLTIHYSPTGKAARTIRLPLCSTAN